jgi:predicted tellurium resistance membrane protein TerC
MLMGAAASVIARFLHRFPWIGYAGVIIVLYVGCRMIYTGGIQLLHAT